MIVTDQLNRRLTFSSPPQRIVSLVPSQTELLYDLGLGERVVGITRFCIYPKTWFRSKTRVGGTKDINIERIRALNPDLILANKEENSKENIDKLSLLYPTWVSDVHHLDSALSMIKSLGQILDVEDTAANILEKILNGVQKTVQNPLPTKKCVYLIWQNPLMTVGGDTFINDMLKYAGFENVFAHQQRYPVLEMQDILQSKADYILLSSEPYPFKERHIQAFQELSSKKVCLVDGEMFSWYGSRMVHIWDYFRNLRSS